jgi:hypothetical protein
MRSPPRNVGPIGFATTATISTPTIAKDSTGAADYSLKLTQSDIPCTIDPASTNEAAVYGGGLVHQDEQVFLGYFPTFVGGGTAVTIGANARVVADSVTYRAVGAASAYADGVQRVPLQVRS